MRRLLVATAVAASLVGTAASAALVDGGFEAEGATALPSGGFCYFNGCGTNSPWSGTTFGSGLQQENNGAWPGVATNDGQYYAFVQGGGTFVQSFTANAGGYGLSWTATGRTAGGYNSPHSYNVLVDNTIVFTGTTTPTGSFAPLSTYVVLSGSGTHTLAFQGIGDPNGADTTSFIDDVALSAAPEPAAWATMLGGFALAGVALRRRRKLALA